MKNIVLTFALLVLASSPGVARASALAGLEQRWTELTRTYVVEERWVDYARWHASPTDRDALASIVREFAALDPSVLSEPEAIAYWINLYNAVTVDLVLEHYPVKSIKDIGSGLFGSPWKIERVTVGGRALTLDAIEHEILRVQFSEPRIHFALNCASVGCPPLAPEAFTGARLDEQLDTVTARALQSAEWVDPSGCDGSYGKGKIRLTKLFDWFRSDFGGDAAVREFVARYRPADAFTLRNTRCDLEYMDYDWQLNAPPAAGR